MKNKFDVIIVGGGTSGCACAYIAGKLGLKTLLIEKNTFLGGSMTSSLVTPAMKTSDNSINNDFFNDFYHYMEKYNGAITYSDGNKGWFNPEIAKIVLDRMMSDANVKILFDTEIENIAKKLSSYIVTLYNNNTIALKQELLNPIETLYLIDATGDAKICQKLNYKFLYDNDKKQPINLRFIMSGVDIKSFEKWLTDFDKDRNVTTSCRINDEIHLSTAYTWDTDKKWALAPLFKKAVKDGVLDVNDTNYFQIFTVAGTKDAIAFNCPRLIGDYSLSEVYIKGREAIYRLSEFCKKYLIGFKNAYISSIANSMGVRVSNRVEGKYIYKKEDIISGNKFDNPVVISNYPIDIHSDSKNKSVLNHLEQEYQLPIESLMVDDNLFVIGRCISAEFEAQAALRIIPSCFSMGEGVAKYIRKQL